MPPGHPLGVTRVATRSAAELGGDIAVIFYVPIERIAPAAQAAKILELMRPSFTESTKVAAIQAEKQGAVSESGFIFMRRGDKWGLAETAAETALVQPLLSDVPAAAPDP